MADNSAKAGSGPARWALILAVVAALAAGGLYLGGYFTAQKTPTPKAVATTPASAPEKSVSSEAEDADPPSVNKTSEPAPDTTARSQLAGAEAEEGALAAPVFDVVRVDPDGNTVIAGSTVPGSRVVILMDEDELQTPEAGADGEFVSLLSLPVSDAPRVLTLRAELDGQSAISVDQIIIAPSPASARSPSKIPEVLEPMTTATRRRPKQSMASSMAS